MMWQCVSLTILAFLVSSYRTQQNDYTQSFGTGGVSGGSSVDNNPAHSSSTGASSGSGAQEPGSNGEGGVDGSVNSQDNVANSAGGAGAADSTRVPASTTNVGGGRSLGSKTLQFPLPSCYINADGFMCCSKELEELMNNTYKTLSTSRNGQWKKCNIHQVAVAVQKNAQAHFNLDFETVVGAGDYASKNYFSKDLICKIKRDSSYILAFASPV